MEIVLVRHGETVANHLKLVQGWIDNPLNDLGKRQAQKAGKHLKSINYHADVAVASPLVRASETGEIMLQEFSSLKELNIDFHFIERNFGPYDKTPVATTLEKVLVKGFQEIGYENDKMLLKRIQTGIDNLYKHYKNKNIIIFCHSHVIKSCLILAEPENYNYKSFVDNGSMHRFGFDGESLKILDFNFYHSL